MEFVLSAEPPTYPPTTVQLDLLTVLQALADPVRLEIVVGIASSEGGVYCKTFARHLAKATRSYHLRILRESGITDEYRDGTNKVIVLRREELDRAFPGLIPSVVVAASAEQARKSVARSAA